MIRLLQNISVGNILKRLRITVTPTASENCMTGEKKQSRECFQTLRKSAP